MSGADAFPHKPWRSWQKTMQSQSVRTIVGLETLTPHELAAWTELSATGLEPTAFNSPCGLSMALQSIAGANGRVLAVVDHEEADRLIAVTGLARKSIGLGFSGQNTMLWSSDLGPIGTPLLADDRTSTSQRFLEALFMQTRATCILFPDQSLNGQSFQVLLSAANTMGLNITILDQWERATLHPKTEDTTFFRKALTRKRRKELARLERRLAEQGALHLASRITTDDVTTAFTRFLKLEAESWKGGRGTALLNNTQTERFSRRLISHLAKNGAARVYELWLGDALVASLVLLSERDHAVTWKIAHDSTYGAFSPGSLLIMKTTQQLIDEAKFSEVDSLADPNHPMIDRLWPDRQAMGDVLIGRSGALMALAKLDYQALRGLKNLLRPVKRRLGM